jgi:hemerythrin-like domain-containing protein
MSRAEYRDRVIELVELLSSASAQMQYERDVPQVDVASEMISMYADDFFHPKSEDFLMAFSEPEIKDLAQLYGMICMAAKAFEDESIDGVSSALKTSEWRAVMEFSKHLYEELCRAT